VKGVYSFFEVPHNDVEKVQGGFQGIDFHGRDVRIEISGEGSSERRGGGQRGERKSYGGNNGYRRDGGDGRERNGGDRRDGGGFRDFSGKRREDRGERRRRF
jgi:ATP-dependent RNA helicase DeaD